MSKAKIKKYRVGEEHIQANGMKAKIIEYKYCSDMIVEFEDGFIKDHVSYYDFINGKILHNNKRPARKKYKQNKIGEKNVSSCNLVMTIVEYRNTNDVDVLFEDGILVKHVRYAAFFQGYLKHPTKKTVRWPYKVNKKLIGRTIRTVDDHYRIIDVHGEDSVDFIRDDGTIFYNKSYIGIKDGYIGDPLTKSYFKAKLY